MSDTYTSKLYVLTYNEVQIAGYRVFNSYTEALKEFIKHCILETKDLLTEEEEVEVEEEEEEEVEEEVEEEDPVVEEIGSESDDKSDEEYDAMSCVFEIQELNGNEFMTVKEYDYEVFQEFIEDKDDILSYLDELEKKIDDNDIPEELVNLFTD
jgi:hypothetical protein